MNNDWLMPAFGVFVQYVVKTYQMPMNFHYKGQLQNAI